MVRSTSSKLSILLLSLSSLSLALPNPQAEADAPSSSTDPSSSTTNSSGASDNNVKNVEVKPYSGKNARLGYTIPSNDGDDSEENMASVPASDLRRSRRKRHSAHYHVHDAHYGTWVGPEWRSIYYDPSHSQHWNFKNGFTNVDGPGSKRHYEPVYYAPEPYDVVYEAPYYPPPPGYVVERDLVGADVQAKVNDPLSGSKSNSKAPTKSTIKKGGKKKGGKKAEKNGKKKVARKFGRRQISNTLASSGVPGFVEIAAPFYNTLLSKTVAGLVYSVDPNDNSSLILGSSPNQSTQFYLTPSTVEDPSDSSDSSTSSISTSTSATADSTSSPLPTPAVLATDGSSALDVVQLRLPVLNSNTMESEQLCAAFNITPPSPMKLVPCDSNLPGMSSNFVYNTTTGELQPFYTVTPATPASNLSMMAHPVNSSSNDDSSTFMTHSLMVSDNGACNRTDSTSGTQADREDSESCEDDNEDDTSDDSDTNPASNTMDSLPVSNSTDPLSNSTDPVSNSTGSSDPGTAAGPVSLYFIPSSAYFQAPDDVSTLNPSNSSTSADSSSTTPINGFPTMTNVDSGISTPTSTPDALDSQPEEDLESMSDSDSVPTPTPTDASNQYLVAPTVVTSSSSATTDCSSPTTTSGSSDSSDSGTEDNCIDSSTSTTLASSTPTSS